MKKQMNYYCGACGQPCNGDFRDFGEDSKRELYRSDCCESLLFEERPSKLNNWTRKEFQDNENADRDQDDYLG